MNAADYNKMMEALDTRIEGCEKYFSRVKSTDDLRSITLGMAEELKHFCLEEEAIMTKIVMVDLYHIIGMGNLTPPQMMQFTYKIQKYLSYRPSVKAIANKFESVLQLPTIPVTTKFKLLALSDLTLKTGEGPEEYAEVDDYRQACAQSSRAGVTDLPFSIVGNTITVQKEKLNDFVGFMKKAFKTSFSLTNLRSKITARSEYAGIRWTAETETEVLGVFSSKTCHDKFVSYYNM